MENLAGLLKEGHSPNTRTLEDDELLDKVDVYTCIYMYMYIVYCISIYIYIVYNISVVVTCSSGYESRST